MEAVNDVRPLGSRKRVVHFGKRKNKTLFIYFTTLSKDFEEFLIIK